MAMMFNGLADKGSGPCGGVVFSGCGSHTAGDPHTVPPPGIQLRHSQNPPPPRHCLRSPVIPAIIGGTPVLLMSAGLVLVVHISVQIMELLPQSQRGVFLFSTIFLRGPGPPPPQLHVLFCK